MRNGIAVFGTIVHDLNKKIDRFVERNGLVRCLESASSMGGLSGNCGRDLAALSPDMPVTVYGMIGTDAAGDEMLERFRVYPNIDLSHVGRKGLTSFTDVLHEEVSKVRSFIFFPGANEYLDIGLAGDGIAADMVHCGYILAADALDREDAEYGTRMARLLHLLQEQGRFTSFDVVSEASDRYRDKVRPCLPYADCVFLNEIEAGRTVGTELRDGEGTLRTDAVRAALRRLKELGAKRYAVIHAPEGAWALDIPADREYHAPGAILPEGFIAGTVGAGDAFSSGVLTGIYRGHGLDEALEDGIAAATMSLRSETPSDAVGTLEEARALLDTLPRRTK